MPVTSCPYKFAFMSRGTPFFHVPPKLTNSEPQLIQDVHHVSQPTTRQQQVITVPSLSRQARSRVLLRSITSAPVVPKPHKILKWI